MISNTDQSVDQEKYGESFDRIFRRNDVIAEQANPVFKFKSFRKDEEKIINMLFEYGVYQYKQGIRVDK